MDNHVTKLVIDKNTPKVVVGKITYYVPFRDRLPPMSQEEYQGFKDNIRQHGCITTPMVGYADRVRGLKIVVVDGAHRLRVVAELRSEGVHVDPHINYIEKPTLEEAERIADDLNLWRRHLTPEQRREYIAKVLKDKPQQSNRQVAKQTGASDKTVANVRQGLEATAEIPQLEKTEGRDGKARPARKEANGKPAAAKTKHPTRDAERLKPAGKLDGFAVERAYEAIDVMRPILCRIPKNDALRRRAFQIVRDWLKRCERGEGN
jgi:hypothetical protein